MGCPSDLLRFAGMAEHGWAGCNGFAHDGARVRYILRIRCSYTTPVETIGEVVVTKPAGKFTPK